MRFGMADAGCTVAPGLTSWLCFKMQELYTNLSLVCFGVLRGFCGFFFGCCVFCDLIAEVSFWHVKEESSAEVELFCCCINK